MENFKNVLLRNITASTKNDRLGMISLVKRCYLSKVSPGSLARGWGPAGPIVAERGRGQGAGLKWPN